MFADDTVLFSNSEEGLQSLFNKLHNFCSEWNIVLNVDKTVATVFKDISWNNFSRGEFYHFFIDVLGYITNIKQGLKVWATWPAFELQMCFEYYSMEYISILN